MTRASGGFIGETLLAAEDSPEDLDALVEEFNESREE